MSGTKRNATIIIKPATPFWRGNFSIDPANKARTHTPKIMANNEPASNKNKERQVYIRVSSN